MLLPTRAGAEVSTTVRSIHEGRHLEMVSERLALEMQHAVDAGRQLGWNQGQYSSELMRIITAERAALKSGDRILNVHYRPHATDGAHVLPKTGTE